MICKLYGYGVCVFLNIINMGETNPIIYLRLNLLKKKLWLAFIIEQISTTIKLNISVSNNHKI